MAATAKKVHYFVINQMNQSADRRGPFVSFEAAEAWANKYYKMYAAWIVPATPVGKAIAHRVLDADGKPI